jgi:site-specific DNA-methyltransferase (adenine-specific)
VTAEMHCGDNAEVLARLAGRKDVAVVSDPPYGMKWNTDSTRFSGGRSEKIGRKRGDGRSDWPEIRGDAESFDPSPWIAFPKVVLWGANHYAARLPIGTTLIWVNKNDHTFGTFLSDAEIGWMKGGHGVYCKRVIFQPPTRAKEGGGAVAHPTQKPIALMRWCIERLKLKPGTTIFDPYMGSGTTGVAAAQLGLSFIGCEIDPGYFKVARRRIDAALAATPLLI